MTHQSISLRSVDTKELDPKDTASTHKMELIYFALIMSIFIFLCVFLKNATFICQAIIIEYFQESFKSQQMISCH